MKSIMNNLAIYLLLLLSVMIHSGCSLDFLTPDDEEEAKDHILGEWDLVRLNGQRAPWDITTGDGQEIRISRIGLEFEDGSYIQTIEANGERGSSEGTWIWLEDGEELSLDNTDYTILELSEDDLEMESESGAIFEYDRD